MRSSKNPKVLYYVIRNMLEPIFKKIAQLKEAEKELRDELAVLRYKADDNMAVAKDHLELYYKREKELRDRIDLHNENLTAMIKKNLLNPNKQSSDSDVEEETKYIIDKALSTIAYGFKRQEDNIIIAGITNRGIAVGEDKDFIVEFEFLNPSNKKFPSYYINDIMKVSDQEALIATNNGLVNFNIVNKQYAHRTMHDGLNTNEIKRAASVLSNDASRGGYIAGTSKGLSYSPNSIRWLDVDPGFKKHVTCFHRSKINNETYNKIFVGTTDGLYYFDFDKYIQKQNNPIINLQSINNILPSKYINSIALNTDADGLYIATEKGVVVCEGVLMHLIQNDINSCGLEYKVVTTQQGLSNNMCFDIIINGEKVLIATANGLTATEDFINFSYITRKPAGGAMPGLENYMCNKLINKGGGAVTILHPVGFTEGYLV
jgi:ligand-binding sensor domain-containing protein